MAFIVEDGTGKPDADSYCSVQAADEYFADRGVSEWAALTPEVKEQSLRKATDHVETWFSGRFRGVRNSSTQALSFPRNNETSIPRNLQRACAEYALRASRGPLSPDPADKLVKSEQKILGPLEKKTEYVEVAPKPFKAYPAADNLLKSLLRSSSVIR